MDLNTPPSLGSWLLRRARDHGLTSTELADLLGLPSHRLRQITTTADLDDLPLRTLRALSVALDLPWPGWLEPSTHPAPQPATPHQRLPGQRLRRVGAVLALVLGQPLGHSQIADVLDRPANASSSSTQLAARTQGRHGLRLILASSQAKSGCRPAHPRSLQPGGGSTRSPSSGKARHPASPTSPTASSHTRRRSPRPGPTPPRTARQRSDPPAW